MLSDFRKWNYGIPNSLHNNRQMHTENHHSTYVVARINQYDLVSGHFTGRQRQKPFLVYSKNTAASRHISRRTELKPGLEWRTAGPKWLKWLIVEVVARVCKGTSAKPFQSFWQITDVRTHNPHVSYSAVPFTNTHLCLRISTCFLGGIDSFVLVG